MTSEHALFFAYGTGANGKSVLLSTVSGMLGSYQKVAPIESFTASNGDRHPTEFARAPRSSARQRNGNRGRSAMGRIADQTTHWRRHVAARFMRQDFFEYKPAFKLIIGGNHKPSLRSVDEAIRVAFT